MDVSRPKLDDVSRLHGSPLDTLLFDLASHSLVDVFTFF